jgi:hypothetical protein
MFTKTIVALGAAAVLAASLGSSAVAQTNGQEWWKAYESSKSGTLSKKNCIRGEDSASSAYPAWMHC